MQTPPNSPHPSSYPMMPNNTATAADTAWWGLHTISAGRTDLWQIGSLRLSVQHAALQWHLRWAQSDDILDPTVRYVRGADANADLRGSTSGGARGGNPENLMTFVFGGGVRSDLSFTPALADRNVVAKLPTALQILPGEDVNLFLLTPLWLRVEVTEPNRLLTEIPAYRPSDTWFGPISNSGELCYASATPAYLDLREVPLRLHCATTAVHIRNLGQGVLRLDRVSIPVPQLSLFYSQRTGFWTDRISFEQRDNSEMAHMRLEKQPPQEASPTQFVTGPRRPVVDTTSPIRSFNVLFK